LRLGQGSVIAALQAFEILSHLRYYFQGPFPTGNYNNNNFITALKLLLGSNYNFTYNSITNNSTISYVSGFTITSNTTMYRFLGLEEGVNTSSINNSITSTFVCNFLPLTRLHFNSPQ
jgi:hypothetical protein